MKEYLIAYKTFVGNELKTMVCCGKDMNEALSQFRKCCDEEIIAITELDDSINSNCL